MTIIAKLQSLDQSLLSDSLKSKVETALKDYPTEEGLLPEEIETLEAIYNKASAHIEKVQQDAKDAEQAKLDAEAEEKRVEDERIEQERIALEETQKAEQIKSVELPYLALFEQVKEKLSPELKKAKVGVDLLRSKFLKNPTESNQKSVLKSSQNYCDKVNAYFENQKNLELANKTKEEQEKIKKQQKEKEERELLEKAETEKVQKEAADKAEAERVENEKKDREGQFGSESLKNIFGV
jgi:hypothetical protein